MFMQGFSVEIQPPTQGPDRRQHDRPEVSVSSLPVLPFRHLRLFVPQGKLKRAFQKLRFVYLFKNCFKFAIAL